MSRRDSIRVHCEQCGGFYSRDECSTRLAATGGNIVERFYCPHDGARCFDMGETDTDRMEEIEKLRKDREEARRDLSVLEDRLSNLVREYESDWFIEECEDEND